MIGLLKKNILIMLFLLLEISACTIGGSANNNVQANSDKNIGSGLVLSLIDPNLKDSKQAPVNPIISFHFNRPVHNINTDNIYITDSESHFYLIDKISTKEEGSDTIYTIRPTLAYDTTYNLVFSSGISDYYGNKLSSEVVQFHTVKNDDSGDDDSQSIKVDFLKPSMLENVELSSNIVFKISERLSSKFNINDVVKLYKDGINGTNVNITITQNENIYTISPNDLLKENTNYCLLIKDPDHSIPEQHIGKHTLCFNTTSIVNYATLLSYKDNIALNSAVLIQLQNNINISQTDISFMELPNNPDNPYSKIEFNYERLNGNIYKLTPVNILPRDAKLMILIKYPQKNKQQIFYLSTQVLGIDTSLEKSDCLISKNQCIFNITFSEAMNTNYLDKLHNTVKIYQDVIDNSHQLNDFYGSFINLNPKVLTITLNTGSSKDNKRYFVVIDGLNDPIMPRDYVYHISQNVIILDKDPDYAKMLSPNQALSTQAEIIFDMNTSFNLQDFSFSLTDNSKHNVSISYEKFGDNYYRIIPNNDLTPDTDYIVYITNNSLQSTQKFTFKTGNYSTIQSNIVKCSPEDQDCSFIIEFSDDVQANQYALDNLLNSDGLGIYHDKIDPYMGAFTIKQFINVKFGVSRSIKVLLKGDYPKNTLGFVALNTKIYGIYPKDPYKSFANNIMVFNYWATP